MASCRCVPLRKKDDRNARARCDRSAGSIKFRFQKSRFKVKGIKIKRLAVVCWDMNQNDYNK